MQGATSKTGFRSAVSKSRHGDRVRHGAGAEEFLTCVLGVAAAGLLASCLAFHIAHEITHLALPELMLIWAAPALAALAGLRAARHR